MNFAVSYTKHSIIEADIQISVYNCGELFGYTNSSPQLIRMLLILCYTSRIERDYNIQFKFDHFLQHNVLKIEFTFRVFYLHFSILTLYKMTFCGGVIITTNDNGAFII